MDLLLFELQNWTELCRVQCFVFRLFSLPPTFQSPVNLYLAPSACSLPSTALPPGDGPLFGPLDGLIDPLIGTSDDANCVNPIGRWQSQHHQLRIDWPGPFPSHCLCGQKRNDKILDWLTCAGQEG